MKYAKELEMMKLKPACCFTGHRQLPNGSQYYLRADIVEKVKYLASLQGITTYYSGGALGFDTLVAESVLGLRNELPEIRLVIVKPFEDQSLTWEYKDQLRYTKILDNADDVICLANHYYKGCMQRRNRFMVDNCCCCLCYLAKTNGGTAYTVKYAEKKNLPVINLALEIHRNE